MDVSSIATAYTAFSEVLAGFAWGTESHSGQPICTPGLRLGRGLPLGKWGRSVRGSVAGAGAAGARVDSMPGELFTTL
jgi:hypothetical protein